LSKQNIAIRRRKGLRDDSPRVFTRLVLSGALVATVTPLLWMVFMAFQMPRAIISPDFNPEFSLTNFRVLLGPQQVFTEQMLNSGILVISATGICVVLSALASYSLSHLNWHPRSVFVFLIIAGLVQLIPPMTLIPGLFFTLQSLGLTGTLLTLVIVNTLVNLPFAIIMMKFYFDSLPPELREAAQVDGASEFVTFRKVMLPLAAPGIAAVAIFVGIQVWNEFLFALIFSLGGEEAPVTIGIGSLIQPWGINWGSMAAAGTMTALPVILLAIVASRQIVAGLANGAVK
jgi:ABC-type glycerol-3-phosphate transport system permease component